MKPSTPERLEPKTALAIAPMREADAEQVSLLFAEVLADLSYYNEAAKRSEAAKYTPALLREAVRAAPDSILVAKWGDRIVGFLFGEEDDGLVWLAWFGVELAYRRCGVGHALLLAIEERALANRTHKIWCDCRTTNSVSKGTLSATGYKQLCTVTNHWYGQDFILWEKLLASPAT